MNDDLISRAALLEWVQNQKAEAYGVYGNIIKAAIDAVLHHNVVNAIRTAPAVDAEPVRHGEWIVHDWAEECNGVLISNYECSECCYWERHEADYCPNCGAKMDKEGDADD